MNTNIPTKDDEEWGNVELPGLSDEELFKKNWNRIAGVRDGVKKRPLTWKQNVAEANRKKHANPEIAKKIAEANRKNAQNPDIRKKITEANRKKSNDPEWRKKQSEVVRKTWEDLELRRRHKEMHNTPEYLEYIQKRNKEIAQRSEMKEWYKNFNKAKREDPIHIEKHQSAVTDRSNNNEEWIRKNCRPVSTPYGIFQKAKDVMDLYHKKYGGKRESVAVKLRNWLHSDKKPDWKYLTWEEYDKLKGQS